ncbi:hypothetical protein JTB14_006278 [Gonioctena quinquepunctata]|nr:hypothetical protein JTB14_006278 [Gonioctena quinquepunctata]
MKLEDKAREYYGALLPIETPGTMDQMKNWFRSVFGRRLTMSTGKTELERCIRNPDETLGEFLQCLKVIANKMFPPSSINTPAQTYQRDILLVNQFMDDGKLSSVKKGCPGWYMRPATMHGYPQYGEWRLEKKYPIVEEGGVKPWKTTLKLGLTKRTNEEEAGISKGASEKMEQIDSPTWEPAVYVAVGCRRPRELFCCEKEGAPCSSNSQHPSNQPNS